jgi:hypothetical protein
MTGGGFGLTDDLVPYFSAMSGSYWRIYAHNGGVHTRGLLSRAACLG